MNFGLQLTRWRRPNHAVDTKRVYCATLWLRQLDTDTQNTEVVWYVGLNMWLAGRGKNWWLHINFLIIKQITNKIDGKRVFTQASIVIPSISHSLHNALWEIVSIINRTHAWHCGDWGRHGKAARLWSISVVRRKTSLMTVLSSSFSSSSLPLSVKWNQSFASSLPLFKLLLLISFNQFLSIFYLLI